MIYNGDIIDGVPVITKLDVSHLEKGKIYRFMFKSIEMNIGQSWYVPVMVAVGKNPGKRLLLNTGIHGDELNGIKVIQDIFSTLDPNQLSGVVIGTLQASPNSLMHTSRYWYMTTDGSDYADMNRLFPGKVAGNTAERHAYKLWNDLWHENVDMVIDLHTQSTDTVYSFFMYADLSIPEVKSMALQFPADHIYDDKDASGTVEGTFDSVGIPAITLELGSPRIFEPEYIGRAIEGIYNLMLDKQMITDYKGRKATDFGTIIGNKLTSIRAEVGGYAEVLVKIGASVKIGEEIAIQKNPFGDLIKRYEAPNEGVVVSIGTGATREAGGLLVRLLSK